MIPKIIHQVWMQGALPPHIRENILKYNANYEYRFYTEDDCIAYISEHFTDCLQCFKALQKPAHKSDLFRYLLLYERGGIYIDADLELVLPLDYIINMTNAQFISVIGAHSFYRGPQIGECCNGFICTVPGNRLLLDLAEDIIANGNPRDYGDHVRLMYQKLQQPPIYTNFVRYELNMYLYHEYCSQSRYYIKDVHSNVIINSNGHNYLQTAPATDTNVFYYSISSWEVDFFRNEICGESTYNFILFDNDTPFDFFAKFRSMKNILIINHHGSFNFMKQITSILSPLCIILLSDETKDPSPYYSLPAKLFMHQYNHPEKLLNNNSYHIPLGYVSGYKSDKTSIKPIVERSYGFSFIGAIKSDRKEMLRLFSMVYPNHIINTQGAVWTNINNQPVRPSDMFNIYNNSVYVPIGRGNVSMNCFRLYEAIVAGAIPVVVGAAAEIQSTFQFKTGMPHMVTADTWILAIDKCKQLSKSTDCLQIMQTENLKWWNNTIQDIRNVLQTVSADLLQPANDVIKS